MSITQKWKKRLIGNFEYLQHLNTLAGRSLNDLTQYPVFPYVLSDYNSETLDLSNPSVFRDLSKPMGAQDPKRLESFRLRYKELKQMRQEPYHYGSHYSNMGVVLHYLVRVEPFATYLKEFQGGKFDLPDRTFHNLSASYNLSAERATSDVRELIPEFFYLPEFLENRQGFSFGTTQKGHVVDHVVLPPWAKDAKKFVEKNREALESEHVSSKLNTWIDLIFGHKQCGGEAVRADNLFHPLTYEGAVDIDKEKDPIQKTAIIAQINSYGQIPKQLFVKPHPARDPVDASARTFISLEPNKLSCTCIGKFSFPVARIAVLNNLPIPLGKCQLVLFPQATKYLQWGTTGQTIKICALQNRSLLETLEVLDLDDVRVADMTPNSTKICFGASTGIVKIWRREMTSKEATLKLESLLYGHTDEVSTIVMSTDFSVVVSGSYDGTAILWDLNRCSYVRSFDAREYGNRVAVVALNPNTGDVLTVVDGKSKSKKSSKEGKKTPKKLSNSVILLWTINGDKLAEVKLPYSVTCATFSNYIQGYVPNLIVVGTREGKLLLFNSSDLKEVAVKELNINSAVTSVCFNYEGSQLNVGTSSGEVYVLFRNGVQIKESLGI